MLVALPCASPVEWLQQLYMHDLSVNDRHSAGVRATSTARWCAPCRCAGRAGPHPDDWASAGRCKLLQSMARSTRHGWQSACVSH